MIRFLLAIALVGASSAANAQSINVRLSEWRVDLSRDTVPTGSVTFQVTNAGTMTHRLFIRGEGVEKGTRDIAAREAASLTVTLKPGTYEVYCPVSDLSHRSAGMTRNLVVIAADSAKVPQKPSEGGIPLGTAGPAW
jgi:plastocyanin